MNERRTELPLTDTEVLEDMICRTYSHPCDGTEKHRQFIHEIAEGLYKQGIRPPQRAERPEDADFEKPGPVARDPLTEGWPLKQTLHYSPYWVTFEDSTGGCCDGTSPADAMTRAKEKTDKEPVSADILPYPASPIIWQHAKNPCPPFCWSPKTCRGLTSCPKRYACSE